MPSVVTRTATGTAHLEIETPAMPTDNGLDLHFSITCNPNYMARPTDLIPIYLETPVVGKGDKPGEPQLLVVVLEPTCEFNHWEVRVSYTLEQLAKVLKVYVPNGQKVTPQTITTYHREVGLRAQWLGVFAQNLPAVNGPRHEAGGLDQKGGSGKIRLLPYTLFELAATEKQRNTSWNMSEKMSLSRPVFKLYGSILQAGKEMTTSLECESEFKLTSAEELAIVTNGMKGLLENGATCQELFDTKKPRIIRPYHVPADLTNAAVFKQADYKQFLVVRDAIIRDVLGLNLKMLELGGNKAHDLAKLLFLIK